MMFDQRELHFAGLVRLVDRPIPLANLAGLGAHFRRAVSQHQCEHTKCEQRESKSSAQSHKYLPRVSQARIYRSALVVSRIPNCRNRISLSRVRSLKPCLRACSMNSGVTSWIFALMIWSIPTLNTADCSALTY